MLDFVKAMKIAERICTDCDGNCKKCCLCYDGSNPCERVCCLTKLNHIAWQEVERRLIEWDKAHPEPKYPKWIDWQQEMFPSATVKICPKEFGENIECGGIRSVMCASCRLNRIPADIAKKLGIKPINAKK